MKWTVYTGSREFSVDRRTLGKALTETGKAVKAGAKFTTREIVAALYGDREREQIGLLRAQREKAERENAHAAGTLVEMHEVERLYTEALLPVRQRLLSLPNEAASRANPTDPAHAQKALADWVDAALPIIRSQLPKA